MTRFPVPRDTYVTRLRGNGEEVASGQDMLYEASPSSERTALEEEGRP